MINNYLKIALRNLRKHRLYAGINVMGLAVGFVCCTFIVLHVVDEISFDRFYEYVDRIVHVVEDRQEDDHRSRLASKYGLLAPALEVDISGVEKTVRVLRYPLVNWSIPTTHANRPGRKAPSTC